MILFVNPGWAFAKSDSEDFIPHVGIDRVTKILIEWEEELRHIANHVELKKNDYSISPSRYILTGAMETYRPLSEFVAELDVIEVEARDTDKVLRNILEKLGV